MVFVWAISATALLTAPAAEAACGGVERFGPLGSHPAPAPLAVGDSVMMGAIEPLRRSGFEVDVRGCRQMSEGLRVLRSRLRAGSLPTVVVVALGHNWTISPRDIAVALRVLGPERMLGLVTPRGALSSARHAIRQAGRRWPDRVRVLRWAARSRGRPWTWDGLHLTPAGARAYARLLSQAHSWSLPGGGDRGGAVGPRRRTVTSVARR